MAGASLKLIGFFFLRRSECIAEKEQKCVHNVTAETTSLAGARAARGSHSPGPQGRTQGPEMLLAPGKALPSGDRAGDRPTPGSGLNRVTAEQSHSSGTTRCNLEINKNPTTF